MLLYLFCKTLIFRRYLVKKLRNKLTPHTVPPAQQNCMPTTQMAGGLLLAMSHNPTLGTTLDTTEATTAENNVTDNSNLNPAYSSGSMENQPPTINYNCWM